MVATAQERIIVIDGEAQVFVMILEQLLTLGRLIRTVETQWNPVSSLTSIWITMYPKDGAIGLRFVVFSFGLCCRRFRHQYA